MNRVGAVAVVATAALVAGVPTSGVAHGTHFRYGSITLASRPTPAQAVEVSLGACGVVRLTATAAAVHCTVACRPPTPRSTRSAPDGFQGEDISGGPKFAEELGVGPYPH